MKSIKIVFVSAILLILVLAMQTQLPTVLAISNTKTRTHDAGTYSFDFPSSCKIKGKNNRFSIEDAQLQCKGDATIQFESSKDVTDMLTGQTDEDLVDTVNTAMDKVYDNLNVVESGTDKYTVNNDTAPYVLATYDQKFINKLFGFETQSKPFVVLGAVVKLNDDDKILFEYKNSEEKFDSQLPMAEKILNSIKSTDSSSDSETPTAEANNSNTNGGGDFQKTKQLCDSVTTQSEKDLCDKLLA